MRTPELPDFAGRITLHGRPWNLYTDGTVLPVVAGGDDSGDGGAGGEGGAGAGDAGGAGGTGGAGDGGQGGTGDAGGQGDNKVTFTAEQQAVIDKLVADKVAETKTATAQSAAADLAKQLGVPVDEAKKIIADAKAKADADKDEKTRREAAEAERDAAKTAEKAIARDATIRIAVADATAGIDAKDDAARAAARADIAVLVSNELGADKLEPNEDDVSSALKAIQGRHPALFAAKKGASGEHSGGPRGNGDKPTGMDAGRDRAKREREEREKNPRPNSQPMTVLGAASN